MVLFDFKSDNHFVSSSDSTTLRVCELSNHAIHPASIRKAHWKEVGSISVVDRDDNSTREVDDDMEGEQCYEGLLFFDGHGKIEGQRALTKLAEELTRLGLMVSPGGYCYQDVTELREHKDFGVHYLRLNDLFNWSIHDVYSARITTWKRVVLKYIVPKHKKIPKSSMVGGGVSKEKYEELKMMLNEKEEELEKVTAKMEDEMEKMTDERDEELRKIQQEMKEAIDKKDVELRKVKKEKGEELRKLRKEKDEEMRKLKREMHDEREMLQREKDEEIAKLGQENEEEALHQLKKKENELNMLRQEADDKLQKLREELEILRRRKDDEETVQAPRKEDDNDIKEALQELIREKDVELQELGKLKDQLLGKLDQCPKNSWSRQLISTDRFYTGGDINQIPKQQVPKETFSKNQSRLSGHYFSSYNYARHISTLTPFNRSTVVPLKDRGTDEWPLSRKVEVWVGNGGHFDVENWWVTKTAHPEGGMTMLAYYQGTFATHTNEYGRPVYLPYHPSYDFCADGYFFLAFLCGQGRLAFMYRD
ncbi:unnamed protein product [Linum trigynum]|uniref:Uncharacterized protein n=1 Tax=Linum trigynum TaxID=586398 RepID=A0AAV2EQN1_9ROSI